MKPVSNLKRKLILIGLIVAFIIIGPWVLMLSFGYTLDDAFSFVKTGGIYVHTEIPYVSVSVNGKYVKDNGLLSRNVLIQKLTPNESYKIEVSKDGYQNWMKTIYVYPSLVSEGHVLMLPNEFVKREIFPFFDKEGNGVSSPITGFTKVNKTLSGRIVPENQEYIDTIALFEGKNPFETKVFEAIKSTNIATSTKTQQLSEQYAKLGIKDPKKLKNFLERPDEISWIQNGNIVLNWVSKTDQVPYYYCNGQKEKVCNDKITLDWANDILKFEYMPGRNDVWIVLINDGIYAVEVDSRSTRNIQKIYLGSNLDFRITSAGKLIVKDKGSFFELAL